MGLLAGNLSFRRFGVVEELPPNFRDTFVEAALRHAFRENLELRSQEENVGWVCLHDADDVDFTLNKLVYDHYLVAALRIDRKRVPAKLLSLLQQRRCEVVRREKGLEKLSTSHKREIREAVHEELLGRALPAVTLVDMAWDLNTGEVRLFTSSDVVADLFRVYFEMSFGLHLVPRRLSHALGRGGMSRAQVGELADALQPMIFVPGGEG